MSPTVWSILQPHKTPEDWQEVMQPDSINSFLFQLLGQLENQGVTNVERICIHPADEEYLEWAKKNGIEWNHGIVGLLHLSSQNGNPKRFREEIAELVDFDVDVWVAEKGIERELRLEPF